MHLLRSTTFAALAALAAAPLAAQVPLSPRALGMGNGYVAAARGEESLWQNPANLGIPGTPHWTFGIPTISAGGDLIGIGFGDLRDIARYGSRSEARRQEIFAKVPAQGTELRADIRAPLFAASIRHFALGVSYNTIASHSLDRDFLDLLFFGFQAQPGRYNITPQETQGFQASYWDFTAAYGKRLPVALPGALSVGVGAHFYLGSGITRAGIVKVDTLRNSLGVPNDLAVTYSGVSRDGANGFGVDLGATYQPSPRLTLSASVSNVVNTFDWSSDRTQKSITLTSSDYRTSEIIDLLDRFDQSEAAYNEAAASANVRALATDLDVDTKLPRTLRVGAALQARPGTLVSAGFHDNLENSRIGGVWDRSLGVGVQQNVKIFAFRAGLASDLEDGTMLTGGFSFGPLHLGLARISDGSVNNADRKGWVATFGLSTGSQSRMP